MTDDLLRHTETDDPTRARVDLDPTRRASFRVDPKLYGKFCEHLGWNISKGMDAQVLANPTFGRWEFRTHSPTVDGGFVPEADSERIATQIDELCHFRDLPRSEPLKDAYEEACAFWWLPLGSETVQFSPDTGPAGDRAQRVEIDGSPTESRGIYQWTYLPAHRTRTFEWEVAARAIEPTTLTVSLWAVDEDGTPSVQLDETVASFGTEWTTETGRLDLPAEADADDLFAFALTAGEPANVVLDRALLYPDDHVDGADPDVIEFLREANLPLLRWPGGNFVSGYDWRDGVGPLEERPTRSNSAWGGIEPNLFGTDEFVAFCDAVGCEPTICVNAGDGTPAEAAAWVEYCNGSPDTPMGSLRAKHGHPEPYDVTYWEIGNELFGPWQDRWTSAAGNADRFERFRDAMKAADESIAVQACGSRDPDHWNDTIIERSSPRAITDHVLAGGQVDLATDPAELFDAFLGFSAQLGAEYRDLRERMRAAGIDEPRLAVTELQLFAQLDPDERVTSGVHPSWWGGRQFAAGSGFPTKKSISEALYDTTIIHECIRLGPFVELLTHSATVNHGGGLQKRRERVWADPAHYGLAMGTELAGGTPIAAELACATIATSRSYGEIDPVDGVPALDVMPVLDDEEETVRIVVVHRASDIGPVSLTIDLGDFDAAPEVDIETLSADSMDAENTLDDPECVAPKSSVGTVTNGQAEVTIPPYSLTLLTFDREED